MPTLLIVSPRPGMAEIMLLMAAGALAVPVVMGIHRILEYGCLFYARRFCVKNGLTLTRWRRRPEFHPEEAGTEFTVFELDCTNAREERRLVRLGIWMFGIQEVLADTEFPASDDPGYPWPKQA